MKLYAGIDLHSNNITLSILNEGEKEIFCKKISLDEHMILNALSKFKENLEGIVRQVFLDSRFRGNDNYFQVVINVFVIFCTPRRRKSGIYNTLIFVQYY